MRNGGRKMDIEQVINSVKESFDKGNCGIVIIGNRSDSVVKYESGGDLEDTAIALLSVMEDSHELANILLWAAEEYCDKRGVKLEIPNDILERNE